MGDISEADGPMTMPKVQLEFQRRSNGIKDDESLLATSPQGEKELAINIPVYNQQPQTNQNKYTRQRDRKAQEKLN